MIVGCSNVIVCVGAVTMDGVARVVGTFKPAGRVGNAVGAVKPGMRLDNKATFDGLLRSPFATMLLTAG